MVVGHMNRAPLLALAAVALAAPTAAAAAPTLSLDAPCYYAESAITATGLGFPASAPIQITDAAGDAFSASSMADPMGTFTASFQAPPAPSSKPAVVPYTATATDGADATQTATASFFDVNAGVDANVNGRLSTPVTWTVAGFVGGQTVYGHWFFEHKNFKTLKMGKVPGACGLVKRRVKRLPVTPRVGIWTAQFDTKKEWHATTKPRVFLRIQVFRRPG